MRPTIALLVIPVLLIIPAAAGAQGPIPARTDDADLDPAVVRKTIADAVAYLKREQRPDGTWLGTAGQTDGVTALCTLALLNCGVQIEDRCIDRALAYLTKVRPENTYATALQTMVFCKAAPERFGHLILRNARWLEATQIEEGDTRGAWSYPGSSGDNSNSQFALLALHEAERAGIEVRARTWQLAYDYWQRTQNPDGSWRYRPDPRWPSTGSMTCAGIAALVITSDRVRQLDATVEGDRVSCCQRGESDDDRIEEALRWLGQKFRPGLNPGAGNHWRFYYLYGVERVGRLTNRRFIGGHDWYREGTEFLIQAKGGVASHWTGVANDAENDPRIATALALLFLSKGRRPVLLAKLKHGRDDDWSMHRSDVDNLTRHIETEWEFDMTWQVIELRKATVDDLLQSPVLYYCGGKTPLPGSAAGQEELAQKLRGYLDRGGFLLAEAYCGGADFDRGFRELMRRTFPEPEYRLRELDSEHSIWRGVPLKHFNRYFGRLHGIDFGCRTSVVYCPPDTSGHVRPSFSCLWELSRPGRGQKYSPAVEEQIEGALAVGNSVLSYATNRELEFKYDIPRHLTKRTEEESFPRGQILLAGLRHPGGCNAAPRALGNLMEAAANELGIRTSTEERMIYITDDSLFDYHMVFMHGRTAFDLTQREREQLRTYVERGGLVFANSICASKAFTESFRAEMEIIFPEHPLEPIPDDHPLLTSTYGGFDLSVVTRHDPQVRSRNEPIQAVDRKVPPGLEGIRFDDRYGVIFSRYDLSCALEKQNSLECQGFTRKDAARIGLNVLLYSLQH